VRYSSCIKVATTGIVIVLVFAFLSTKAYAEFYVAGELGYALSDKVDSLTPMGTVTSLDTSEIKLKRAFAFGGKVGYFMSFFRWLGVEAEGFTTTPHFKEQTINGSPSRPIGPFPAQTLTGARLEVTTYALNVIARLPLDRFEPYVGIGPAIYHFNVKNDVAATTDSSTHLGLNALAGVRFFLTSQLAVFGEFKHSEAKVKAANLFSSNAGAEGTYSANLIFAGISFHF
jgi:opacity protein-like surface antigen